MDAAQLLEEYRLAQEEHARALTEVKEMRQRVEEARAEAEAAQATERKYERDMEVAAAKLVQGLSQLQVEDALCVLPPVQDSFIEYHANIGCYHCYLSLGSEIALSDIDTSVLSVSVELTKVTLSSGMGAWWTVELERKVDAENCSIITKDDHIYVRLPVSPSDKETVDGFSSFSQTSQEELRVHSYSKLYCHGCKSVLLDDSHVEIEKVLPLPSENWMEMFDFWGAGIGSFEHIPREGIFAQEHRILVGESSIIIHENDLIQKTTVIDAGGTSGHTKPADEGEEDEKPDWRKLCCSKCNVTIGERRIENPATLRLQKHLIAATSRAESGNSLNVFERYTIDNTISAQMLHIAESDGIFRFLLCVHHHEHGDQKFGGLQLQLLSWDAKIRTTKSSSCALEFRRVLKVVYASGSGSAVSPAPAAQAELPPMLRTQELTVTAAVGWEIVQRLQQSTLMLPPSQRNFNKMTVGYLYA